MDKTSLPSFIVVFLVLTPLSYGGKILYLCGPFWSHVIETVRIAEHLENNYGHSNTFFIQSLLVDKLKQQNLKNISIIEDKVPFNNEFLTRRKNMCDKEETSPLQKMFKVQDVFINYCHQILSNTELVNSLKDSKFDTVIIDGIFPFRGCQSLLAYKLHVPFISVGGMFDPVILNVPFHQSVTPNALMLNFDQEMSFIQRLLNTLFTAVVYAFPAFPLPYDIVAKYVPERPFISTKELLSSAEMYLVNQDPILETPKPSLPHVQFIGGLATTAPCPLRGDFKRFMDSATHGAVIVSFGSVVEGLPDSRIQLLLTAFQKMKNLKFIFKVDKAFTPNENIENVLIVPWMPQNDLLAHPNTVLFITHCGKNGQYEALYNGVPMIGLPLFGDQFQNSKALELKKFGLTLSFCDFTENDILSSIHKVTKGEYKKRISEASAMFRSRPETPSARGAYWIDHIMKYGGEHYHYIGTDLPFYKLYLLDVITFIMIVIVSIILFIRKMYNIICRFLCNRKLKQE